MTTPHEPHFFKPLLPGFHTCVTIPVEFFSKHIQGSEKNKPWKLRSDASDQVWEVIREGRTLTKGWKEFATALMVSSGISSQSTELLLNHFSRINGTIASTSRN